MTDEEDLLEAVRANDDALRRIAWVYGNEDGAEEDLYQEILTEAWRSLPSFRGGSAMATWLYRVAINTGLTWRRQMSKHVAGRVPLSVPGEDHGRVIEPAGAAVTDSGATVLADFLGTLSGANHTVLLLYMEGLTHKEIAEVTGLSVNAIAVRIHRMKQSFTERYVEG